MNEQDNVILGIGITGLEELERIKAILIDLNNLGDKAQGTIDRLSAGMRGVSQSTPPQTIVRAMAVSKSKKATVVGSEEQGKIEPVNSAQAVGGLRAIKNAAEDAKKELIDLRAEYDETLARGRRVAGLYESLQDAYKRKLDPTEISRRREAYMAGIKGEFPGSATKPGPVVIEEPTRRKAAPTQAPPQKPVATTPSASFASGDYSAVLKQLQSINKSTAKISSLSKNVESIAHTVSEIAGLIRNLPSSKQAVNAVERARQAALPVPTGQPGVSIASREYLGASIAGPASPARASIPVSTRNSPIASVDRLIATGAFNTDIANLFRSLFSGGQSHQAAILKDLFSGLPAHLMTAGVPGGADVKSIGMKEIFGSTAGASPTQRMSKLGLFFSHIQQRLKELDVSWQSGYDVTMPEKPIHRVTDDWSNVPVEIQEAFNARLAKHPGVAKVSGMNKMTAEDYQRWFAQMYFSPKGGKPVADFMESQIGGKGATPFASFLDKIRRFRMEALRHEATKKAQNVTEEELQRLNYMARPQHHGGAILYDLDMLKPSKGGADVSVGDILEGNVEDLTAAAGARTSRNMMDLVAQSTDIRALLANPQLFQATHGLVTSAAIQELSAGGGAKGVVDILKSSKEFGLKGLPENVIYSLMNTGFLRSPQEIFGIAESAGVSGKGFQKTIYDAVKVQAGKLKTMSPEVAEVLEYFDYYMGQGDFRKASTLLSKVSKIEGAPIGPRQQILEDMMVSQRRGPSAKTLVNKILAASGAGQDPFALIDAYLKKGASKDFGKVLETGFYGSPADLAQHFGDIGLTPNAMKMRKTALSYFTDVFKKDAKAFPMDEIAMLFEGLSPREIGSSLNQLFPKVSGGKFAAIRPENLRREALFSAIKREGGLESIVQEEAGLEKLRTIIEDASKTMPAEFDRYGRLSDKTKQRHPRLWTQWEKENPLKPREFFFDWDKEMSTTLDRAMMDDRRPRQLVDRLKKFAKRLGFVEDQFDKVGIAYDQQSDQLQAVLRGDALKVVAGKRSIPAHIRRQIKGASSKELADMELTIDSATGRAKLTNLKETLALAQLPLGEVPTAGDPKFTRIMAERKAVLGKSVKNIKELSDIYGLDLVRGLSVLPTKRNTSALGTLKDVAGVNFRGGAIAETAFGDVDYYRAKQLLQGKEYGRKVWATVRRGLETPAVAEGMPAGEHEMAIATLGGIGKNFEMYQDRARKMLQSAGLDDKSIDKMFGIKKAKAAPAAPVVAATAQQETAVVAEKQAEEIVASSKKSMTAAKRIGLSAKKISAALEKVAEVLGVTVKEVTFSETGLRRAGVPASQIADLQAGGIEAYVRKGKKRSLLLNKAFGKDVLRDAEAHGLGHAAMDLLGLGKDDPIVKAMALSAKKLSASSPELNKTMLSEAEGILGLKFTSGLPSRKDIIDFIGKGDIAGLKAALSPFIKGGSRESMLSKMSFDESLVKYFGDNSELSAELFRGLLTDPTATMKAAPKSVGVMLNTLKRSRSSEGKALYELMSDYLGADTFESALAGVGAAKPKSKGKRAGRKVTKEADKAASDASDAVASAAENAATETAQEIKNQTKKRKPRVGGQRAQAAAQTAAQAATQAAAMAGGAGGGAGGTGGGGPAVTQAWTSGAGGRRRIIMDTGGLRRPWEITQEERVASPYYEAAGSRTTGWLGATARVAMYGSAMGVVYGGFSMFTRQIQEAKELEQRIVDLKKVMEPDTDFKSIFDSYWESAIKFGRAISEVAEIGKVFAQQGLKQKEIIELTRVALVGMNSAELSAAESVEFLTSVYNTWNIEAEKSIHFLDKIMAVQAKFAVTAKELTESSMILSPIERTLGGTFDEMLGDVTAIKEITRQPASRITTGLKTVYGRYSEPTHAKKLKERWGIVVRGDEGIVSPTELWGELSRRYKAGELSETDLFDISKVLGGVRHFHYILSLIKNYDTALEATKVSEKANMDAQKASDLQMQTTAYQWMAATNAIKEFGVAISNLTVLPVLKNIASAVKAIGSGLTSVTRQRTWWSEALTTGLGVAGAGFVGSKLLNLGTKTALTKQMGWVDKTMVSGEFDPQQLDAYLKQTGLLRLGITSNKLFGSDATKKAQYGKSLLTERKGQTRLKMTMPGLGWFQMYGPMAMAQGAGLTGAARQQYNAMMRESFLSMFDMLNYSSSDAVERRAKMFEYQDYSVRQAARLSPRRGARAARKLGSSAEMAIMFPAMMGGAWRAGGDASGFAAGIEGAVKSTGRFSALLHALPAVIRGIGASLASLAIPMAVTAAITGLVIAAKKLWEYLRRNNIEFKKSIDFSSQNSKEMGQFLAKLTGAGENADPTQMWMTNKDKVIQIMNAVHDEGITSYQDLAARLNEISGKANLFDVDSAKESWMVMRRFLETEVFAQYGQILEKMRKDAAEKLLPEIGLGVLDRNLSANIKYAGAFGGLSMAGTPSWLSRLLAGGIAPAVEGRGQIKFAGFARDILKNYYGKGPDGEEWDGIISGLKRPGEISQVDSLLNTLRDLNKRYAPGSEFMKRLAPKEQVELFSKEPLGKAIFLALREEFTGGLGNIEAARAIDNLLGKGAVADEKDIKDKLISAELQKLTSTGIEFLAREMFGVNLDKYSPELKKAFEARNKDLVNSAGKAAAGLMDFSETLAAFKGQFHSKLVDWTASLGKAIARNEEYASIGEAYSLRQEAARIGKEGMLLRKDFDIDIESGMQKSKFVLDFLTKQDKSKTEEYFKFVKNMSLERAGSELDPKQMTIVAELWEKTGVDKLETLAKAIAATRDELKAAGQEKAAEAYSKAIADSIYELAKDLAILGSEVAMTLEKESIKIWKESQAAIGEGGFRWEQAGFISGSRAESFANKLAQVDSKERLTRLLRGGEWKEKEAIRQLANINPLTGEPFVPHEKQQELLGFEKKLFDAETDRLAAVDRLNAAIDIQTEVTREYSEALSQAKGILSSTFSDYKTIYGAFFGGAQELRNIDAQIAQLRRQGTPEADARITDLEREKKNIKRQRPKPWVNLLEQFGGFSGKSLFDEATDLFTDIKIGGGGIGDFLAKFTLGTRGKYLDKEGFAAEAMYEDAKKRLRSVGAESYENRMYWIELNQWRTQQGIKSGIDTLVNKFVAGETVTGLLNGAISMGGTPEAIAKKLSENYLGGKGSLPSGYMPLMPEGGLVGADAEQLADRGPDKLAEAKMSVAFKDKMAGYMALASIAGNIGGAKFSQAQGRTGEYAGLGGQIGSGIALALGITNPLLGIGFALGGSLIGALASPKLDKTIDRNTQAIQNNTSAIEKLSSAIFHAPTTFSMPRSMLGDIGNYDVGFDRVPARPTILPA